jgi:broad specificity phosphatase PhoE
MATVSLHAMTPGEIVLLRHGETEWSATGRHTGRTDVPLTPRGEQQAREAGAAIARQRAGRIVVCTLASPLRRAWQTAELAGLPRIEVASDLQEWDYGGYEGLTTAEIRQRHPGWLLWRDGVVAGADHPGEAIGAVAARADAVIARVAPMLAAGDVMLVSHGHFSRVLAARWLGFAPEAGGRFALDTASICVLGFEHEERVIRRWNDVASP